MNLPIYLLLTFTAATLLTLFFLFKASGDSYKLLTLLCLWLLLQGILARAGFYMTNTSPPRILAALLPPMMAIAWLMIAPKGKGIILHTDPGWLTLLHSVRVLVEICLFWLFIERLVPELMTFEGRNFDILSGITAPFVYYFGFVKKNINTKLFIAWNVCCLFLLINIVVNAVLSAPTQFQQFGFDQPNVAILQFPFVWLPSFIVPAVLFSHLFCIRAAVNKNNISSGAGGQ